VFLDYADLFCCLLRCAAMRDGNIPVTAEQELARESGLRRTLGSTQVAMMGIGCTLGTGLFLSSAIGVQVAGPAVVLSFAGGALIALTVMWALAEMSAELPTAGAFGVHAEVYFSRWAGFAVRLTYWVCLVMIVGSEIVAAAIFCQLWFPRVPPWMWVLGFAAALFYMNTLAVESFGTIEYWFAMIKVVTAAAFLVVGCAILLHGRFGNGTAAAAGAVPPLNHFAAYGGLLPHGWAGVGLGVTLAVFSYLGLEVVAATAGEAIDPRVAVPKAFKRTLFTLALFYVGGLAIVVGIVPWTKISLGESPFVTVFQIAGLPAATHIMNFVVLSAALSSATCNLYFCSRLLFSLSRSTYAPAVFGKLSKRGVPVAAVVASSVGMVAALLLSEFFQNTAFVFLIGVAFFGGPFVWTVTLLTHIAFRRKMAASGKAYVKFAPLGIWSSVAGVVALVAVLVSTWWVPTFHVALMAGPPWLGLVTGFYWWWKRKARA
jgi:amino acid transporter, AAT family